MDDGSGRWKWMMEVDDENEGEEWTDVLSRGTWRRRN